jgi:hypothetical protein
VRIQLLDLVCPTYEAISPLLDSADVVDYRHLREEVLRESGLSLSDMLGPSFDGPLATVAAQGRGLRSQLMHDMVTRREEYMHEAHGEETPAEEDRAGATDPAIVREFLEHSSRSAEDVMAQIASLYEYANELDQSQLDRYPELRGSVVTMRKAARDWDRVVAEPSDESAERASNTSQAAEDAAMASRVILSVSSILAGAEALVRALWALEREIKERLQDESDEGLRGLLHSFTEGQRSLMKAIDDQEWEFDKPGSPHRKTHERAQEILAEGGSAGSPTAE